MKECSKCRHCYDDEVQFCPLDNNKPVFTISGSTTISGRYILETRLGQGGMGIVFRAKHKFLKSFHAIKIILPSLVDADENLLVRFRQEAVLAASIDHQNVIRVTDFGVEGDVMPFLVMEFIDGPALSQFLIDEKPLPLKDALELFIPVAQAVAEAHRKGIVHRDLKPQNVMVQKNLPLVKAIKVLDFGLAKIKSADSYPSLIQAKTMNIVGSPPYMSPEQWSGEGVDHRTDIYALGILFFQMLTGRLPFQADSMPAMMYQHLSGPIPTAESMGVSLSPLIEAVAAKAIQKDPQHRYESIDLMLADLGNALANMGQTALAGEITEAMMSSDPIASSPGSIETKTMLSDSQKERFYSYFESQGSRNLLADPKLAQDFLKAQDKIESAKTEAINADLLVREFAEAQKEAEEAQHKAILAKQRIEADVRRQVEAEMERLAAKDQAKQEAEAERLSREIEARRMAEERANYLAQAALEAQQLAETERKKREEEAQQRELHEGERRQAVIEAQRLAEQVAEARKEYENAKGEAAREAQFRAEAELKQKKVESELQAIAADEAERRKLVEARAKEYIEQQARRYESEALAAKQRLDEAKALIELEAEKREKAEAARLQAEKEAERLSQEIIEVQRQMQEMQQHITSDGQGRMLSGSQSAGRTEAIGMGSASTQVPSFLLRSSEISKRNVLVLVLAGVFCVIVLAGAGVGLYLAFGPGPPPPPPEDPPSGPVASAIPRVLIQGGTFMMGRDDVPDKKNPTWADQYPANQVSVDSFVIDKYETTNAQYAEFVKETHREPPAYWNHSEDPPEGKENFPVTNITLADAKAYADWTSKREKRICRLPTEKEWEYAARNGAQGTSYPWGNDWRPDAAILGGQPAAVGTTADETVLGVKDMLGNVTEWTSDLYLFYKGSSLPQRREEDYIVVRGLNFRAQTTPDLKDLFRKTQFMLTYRNQKKEDEAEDFLGFRLVCAP